MSTAAQLKAAAKAKLQAEGVKVIGRYDQEVPNKTARLIVKGGKLIIERHVVLDAAQTLVRSVKRHSFALQLLNKGYIPSDVFDAFAALTPAQQAEVDSKIVGYRYE